MSVSAAPLRGMQQWFACGSSGYAEAKGGHRRNHQVLSVVPANKSGVSIKNLQGRFKDS
jgi:hypothetical protein